MTATMPLRRIARLAYGDALATDVRVDGDVPVMSSGGVSGTHSEANTLAPVVVVGRKGTFGSVHWSDSAAFVIDTAYYVDQRLTQHDLRWLHYVLRTVDFASTAQDVGVPGLSRDAAYDLPCPIPPPLDTQRRIADFLDDQVSRIDEAVRLRREQIEALEERLDADWAFLAGALMAEGSVVPLRRLLSSIVDGPFGSSLTSAHYSDEGTRVIRLGNLGRSAYRYGDEAFVPSAYGQQLAAHAVLPGDLLIAGLGDETWPLGRATVAPDDLGDAIVKADCYRARLKEGQSAEFIAWFLSSPVAAEEFRLLSRGSTRARLNTGVVRDVHVPLIDPARQVSLLDSFRAERRAVDSVTSEMTAQIDLLQQRKRSLITAAVTGEFDVTTASGRGI